MFGIFFNFTTSLDNLYLFYFWQIDIDIDIEKFNFHTLEVVGCGPSSGWKLQTFVRFATKNYKFCCLNKHLISNNCDLTY